ncbi:MAG: efflux RND transporter periplasmic adaptor subunit [Deltaproteobacteria bacterium]|nr:efflux RND transporter periplasmic adaptor subunit [Deltaproteobacteria bacterium]MBN2687290.1 efflux RND transporter periplasmic adaptor subunit [Deltaproteobacteria bacterium]
MKAKICVLSIIMLLLPAFSTRSAENQKGKPVPVELASIKQETLTVHIKTVGKLMPDIEELSFKIKGRLSELIADTGDMVKRGQVLALLEKDDALDREKDRKLLLDQAKRKFERMNRLHEKEYISHDDFEDTMDAFQRAQIAYDQAVLDVERCTMTAPSDGKILHRYLDYLTTVDPGTPIFSFKSTDKPWIIKVNLADLQALTLETGCPAEVILSPYPGTSIRGTVSHIASRANPSDGLYEVEITIIPGENMVLKPGLLAHVDISRQGNEPFSIVPLSALLNLRGMSGHVFVADADRTHAIKKYVTIRHISETDAALEEDLSAYDCVVTHGNQEIEDMSLIAPIE